MDASAVRERLLGARFATVEWVEETGSTNDDLLDAAQQGAPDGMTLVAGHQRAGRGRLNRRWEAPAGSSLLLSVLVRPRRSIEFWHNYTTAMGLAALEAVESTAGLTPGLKWPNDLIEPEPVRRAPRKLAGILADSVVEPAPALIIGVGINVSWPTEVPPELSEIAVALNHLTGREVRIEDLCTALLETFGRRCEQVDEGADAVLLDAYRRRCSTVGRRVRAELPERLVEGVAADVTAAGHLLIDTPEGVVEIAAGDVTHLREAAVPGEDR